jgi:hypothetical protein
MQVLVQVEACRGHSSLVLLLMAILLLMMMLLLMAMHFVLLLHGDADIVAG